MTGRRSEKLRTGHREALGLSGLVGEAEPPAYLLQRYYEKHPALKGVAGYIIREAWFSRAHLLLQPEAMIAVAGCGDGAMSYALAAMNPTMHIIGIDEDRKALTKARSTWNLPNLEFQYGNLASDIGIKPESVDAVISSFTLHEIYSRSRFNDRQIIKTLDYHLSLIKPDGMMYIRDHALHYTGEYILMEMPVTSGSSKDIESMGEADLLVWYAENALSRENPGCHGFFLEELPPRFPQTRLFRLPYKWAYEFILRKDDRSWLKADLNKEYTFFTEREFVKTLRSLGARVLYSSPHWNDTTINTYFENRFRMYDENGHGLGQPPTSFIAVVQKKGERKSLNLQERRPSHKVHNTLRISAMRNEKTGQLVDILTRDVDITEVIPYRVTEDGQLNVFVHGGLPRGIVNTVPRNGRSLDGKRWSGHMVEAIAIPTSVIADVEAGDLKDTVLFARDQLALKPVPNAQLEKGHSYYPAPDSIDELIKTRYLHVSTRSGLIEPRAVMDDVMGFTTNGRIREVSAQCLLDFIAVGFIPNARLEMQVLWLFEKLKMEAEGWDECPLVLEEGEPTKTFDIKNFMKLKAEPQETFKKARGTAGQLRVVQSTFVDEGWVQGGLSGLASRDLEFIISEENTTNKAVILPLTMTAEQVMVGVEVNHIPVPQRHEGSSLSVMAPSVNLPKEVTDIYQARRYIADLYKVPLDKVWRLGESYFCHAAVTPQRIFPFAIAVSPDAENPAGGPFQFAPLKELWNIMFRIWDHKHDTWFLSEMVRVYRRMGQDSDIRLRFGKGKNMLKPTTSPLIQNLSVDTGMGGGGGGKKGKNKSVEPSSTTPGPAPSFQTITQNLPPPVAEQNVEASDEGNEKAILDAIKKKLHIK